MRRGDGQGKAQATKSFCHTKIKFSSSLFTLGEAK